MSEPLRPRLSDGRPVMVAVIVDSEHGPQGIVAPDVPMSSVIQCLDNLRAECETRWRQSIEHRVGQLVEKDERRIIVPNGVIGSVP